MIAAIRARMNPKCAVRESMYCDTIIAMRLQNVPYRDIEDWLMEKGDRHRIAASTICKNLTKIKMKPLVKTTYAEEMIERLGGVINVDPIREMQQNIFTQKQRVDHLVRREQEQRKLKNFENYSDKRIVRELTIYQKMLVDLHTVLNKLPEEALAAMMATKTLSEKPVQLSPAAEATLVDMLLSGEITMDPERVVN